MAFTFELDRYLKKEKVLTWNINKTFNLVITFLNMVHPINA